LKGKKHTRTVGNENAVVNTVQKPIHTNQPAGVAQQVDKEGGSGIQEDVLGAQQARKQGRPRVLPSAGNAVYGGDEYAEQDAVVLEMDVVYYEKAGVGGCQEEGE
jgi:protein-disulfide isomerase